LKKQSTVFRNHALARFRLGGVGTANEAKRRRLHNNLASMPLLVWPVEGAAASINAMFTHLYGLGYTLLVSMIETIFNVLYILTYWLRRAAL
jgi:hypothetical protein